MDQNQTAGTPDNDLQQAIDNISNKTNQDPVFSDPATPPVPDPSDDFGAPIGPFPLPDTNSTVGVVTEGPEPIAPLDPISLPDLSVSGENPADAKVVTKTDTPANNPAAPNNFESSQTSDNSANPNQPSFENNNPQDNPQNTPENTADNNPLQNSGNTPENNPLPGSDNSSENHDQSNPLDSTVDTSASPLGNSSDSNSSITSPLGANSDARQIREAALRELAPILDHANLDPSKKFKVCQEIFEDLHDYSVLDQAYKAASDIQNEDERANSLLYLIESIDSM